MNVVDVRAGNIQNILSALRFSQGMTKRDLSQVTGLSFSTVGTLCALLEEAGILEEIDTASLRVGRIPKAVRIRQQRCLTICLDFQRENSFGLGILGIDNRILFSERYDTRAIHSIEALVAFAHKTFETQRQHTPWMAQSGYIGVGVAVSGVFDKESRRIANATIPMMENALVTDTVEQVFGLPCYTDNEANLCAVAMGQLKSNVTNLLYLHLSQGVGIGVICEGQLLRGNRGYAAEISHIPLGTPSKQCPSCGNFGCVETDLCVRGMVDDFDHAEHVSYSRRWQEISQLISTQENSHTRQYISQKGQLMGVVLSILVNLFDPQEIYLGGECWSIFPQLEPVIQQVLQQRCAVFQNSPIPIFHDCGSEKSIILGLNQMIYERWEPFAAKGSLGL